MSCTIFINTIPDPEVSQQVATAVTGGIGEKSDAGQWIIGIFVQQDRGGFLIQISGPSGFSWKRAFEGEDESPEFIQRTVCEVIG